MRKLRNWMFAAALFCGTAAIVSSCSNVDTPVSGPTAEEDEQLDFPKQEIDPSEFQPTDISLALLGSLKNSAEMEATRYWFKDVQPQVTDKTMVVVTDEINATNEADILKVLGRYGVVLVVEPKEDNVRKYSNYFGLEPNEDFSKVELIGLSGFGDSFVSYIDDSEDASDETAVPSSIAGEDIWDVAPGAYLRLKAFAKWVDRIVNKYDEYQNQLEERQKAIAEAIAAYEAQDEAGAARALTRADQNEKSSDKLNINNIRGWDTSKHLFAKPKFQSYDNAGRSNDEDVCPLSVTCNYSFKPLYQFAQGSSPGADYYIVETSVDWDCSETLKGFKQFDHGSGRDRRSYLFFPIECKFYHEPMPTSSNYSVQMLAGSGGDLKPDNVIHTKSVSNIRSFSVDGNVSGGSSVGIGPKGPSAEGKSNVSLGMGANWLKTETFTVAEYDVSKIVSGQRIGHTITVPGGDDGYRPRMKNKSLDQGFEVSGGVNFAKSLHTNESWVWKVSGTSADTKDASIKVKFDATPKVSWSSYFYTYTEWGVSENSLEMSTTFEVPAPNREDCGFITIKNTGDEDGNPLAIFGIKAIDVTDPNNTFVAYENQNSVFVLPNNSFTFGLPAGKTYDIELEMGRRANKTKIYHLDRNWKVTGITKLGKAQELVTDMLFSEKK